MKIKIFQSDHGVVSLFLNTLKHTANNVVFIINFLVLVLLNRTDLWKRSITIVEIGLTLLFQLKLVMKYWVNVFITSIFLINWLFPQNKKKKTPSVKLFGTTLGRVWIGIQILILYHYLLFLSPTTLNLDFLFSLIPTSIGKLPIPYYVKSSNYFGKSYFNFCEMNCFKKS